MTLWKLATGANIRPEGGVRFRVWAPQATTLEIRVGVEHPTLYSMQQAQDGYFELELQNVNADADYLYVINGKEGRPDPVSRSQPYGVHSHSRIVNSEDYRWNDLGWKGLPLHRYIIYELHVGTFTTQGTLDAAIAHLPDLRDLGITAIELMPITSFPGTRNWGYDQTHPYAPHQAYGGHAALKRFVDACHHLQLAVVLDVVYNHLGPEGNYLAEYGPYFTDQYKTPWGQAINYDGPGSDSVRRYFIDNALYWLTEYHIDALRLDAIHAIYDLGACHILYDMQNAFQQQADHLGRQAFIIAESDLNDTRVIARPDENGYGINAQWNDDFHHSVHALLTQAKHGYFQDFGNIEDLAKALTQGFVYDWKFSHYRNKHFGSCSVPYPGEQFIVCLQNHDQIANACQGKRLGNLIPLEAQKLATCVLLFAPNIPLLFMGQEWGASTPFHFFTSFEDSQLAEKVNTGHQQEQARYGYLALDCQSLSPFQTSKLNWHEREQHPHCDILRYYHTLLTLRHQYPCLHNCRKDLTTVEWNEHKQWLSIQRSDPKDPARMILMANFSDQAQTLSFDFPRGLWSLAVDSASKHFGGPGTIEAVVQKGSSSSEMVETVHMYPHHALIFVLAV